LDNNKLDKGFDLSAGIDMWYHLVSNMYLYGKAEIKMLSIESAKSPYLSNHQQNEYWFGFAFMKERKKQEKHVLKSSPYVRTAYGFATTSTLGDIVSGATITDKEKNRMFSLFYGYPVSDTLFQLSMPVYITPGIVWHQNSKVQDDIFEFVLAFKTYYTLPLPVQIRLGVAQGLSYATSITYIEKIDMDPGIISSKLLYHLGFSVDLEMSDIFGKKAKGFWLGYDIHHRSAVFETASEFGRYKGGSNYNTFYLQYHY
jgi:outer membrane protein